MRPAESHLIESGCEDLRDEMPVCEHYAYFDHAAVAPLPRCAAAAIQDYAAVAAEHGDAKWLDWAAKVGGLRTSLAGLLNCSSTEVALVNNTTQGINLIAEGIPWRKGDNLVVPNNEFPSNMLPWQSLERLGVEVRQAEIGADESVSVDDFAPLIDDKTRLIAFSWVGFASGYRADVDAITQLAHEAGAMVLLDAIQGLGAFSLDVRQTPVDFVVADGHKWMLGPEGAGFLFIREELLDRLRPTGIGWNSLAHGAFDLKPGAHLLDSVKRDAARYEGGTTNMGGMLGFSQSVDLLLRCGLNESRLSRSVLTNVARLEDELRLSEWEVLLPADEKNRSGIVGLRRAHNAESAGGEADAALLNAARKHLLEAGIVTSVRAKRLRIAAHAYNNADDIDRLVETLKDFAITKMKS